MSNETHSEQREKAKQLFMEYFRLNYPGPNTVISNPDWHSPKIFNALMDRLEHVGLSAETHSEKGLREAAEALLAKLDQVAKDTAGIFVMAHVHGQNYSGANWSAEYEAVKQALAATPAVREPGPAITEAQAQDAYCDSFDTDAPAVAPAPDFKRLAKAINRFLVAPSSAGEAAPATPNGKWICPTCKDPECGAPAATEKGEGKI